MGGCFLVRDSESDGFGKSPITLSRQLGSQLEKKRDGCSRLLHTAYLFGPTPRRLQASLVFFEGSLNGQDSHERLGCICIGTIIGHGACWI
jgi:hypothetical protein